MKLSLILKAMDVDRVEGRLSEPGDDEGGPDISSIHHRSADVKPGGMFFAIKGLQADGHRYIGDALSKGAVVIVAESGYFIDNVNTIIIRVGNTRKALASVSSAYFGNPSEKLYLIGITGTNGKTTTAYMVEALLRKSGMDVGVISTINYRYHGKSHDNPLTTPESLELQRILAEMVSAGVTHAVMEVSSHGIALERIHHCWFDMGIYTNLSQDHLDFHGTMEEYGACKKRFFTDHLTSGPKKSKAVAVINTGNPEGIELLGAMKNCKVITVGSNASSDVFARRVTFDQCGMNGKLRFLTSDAKFSSNLIGRYNLENIICAAGAGTAMNMSPETIMQGIESFDNIPGRLERIPDPAGRHVFVDYAHTPDALENVLATLKEVITGRLICVFGCGGDRDRDKRPEMGKIAAELSDLVVITSDNPRTEDPESIIEDIRKGVTPVLMHEYQWHELENGFSEKGNVVEPDRERAIDLGIRISCADDTLLIAGKGHEDYQIIGQTTIAFDDREKARKALAGIHGDK